MKGKKVMKVSFEKIQAFMEAKLVPIATKLATQKHLAALRDGLTILIPFTVIGGISLMLANPPVDLEVVTPTNLFFKFLIAWKHFAMDWSSLITIPFNLTIGIVSVYVVFSVAYRLAQHYKMEALPNAFTATFIFACVAGAPQIIEEGFYIDIAGLGAGSMFTAILMAIAIIEINHFMIKRNIKITMPESVPPMVAGPFEVLLPLVVNTLLFIGIDQLILQLTGSGLTSLVFTIFTPLISASSSLPSVLVIVLLIVIFWFFGIHGDNMVSAIASPIFTGNLVMNLDAYNSGKEIPTIFAGNFNYIFGLAIVWIAILINMIFVCKNERLRSLGKLAIPSSLFNINEPLIFGVPTVLNVLTFIPSIICVIINISTAYFASYFGIMNKTVMSVPWTLPAPLYAFLATLDIRAMFVWFLLLIVNVIIFIPFMRSYDKQLNNDNTQTETNETKIG